MFQKWQWSGGLQIFLLTLGSSGPTGNQNWIDQYCSDRTTINGRGPPDFLILWCAADANITNPVKVWFTDQHCGELCSPEPMQPPLLHQGQILPSKLQEHPELRSLLLIVQVVGNALQQLAGQMQQLSCKTSAKEQLYLDEMRVMQSELLWHKNSHKVTNL